MVQQISWIHFPKSNNSSSGNFTLNEWMKETYLTLMNDNWKLNDIDEMDIYYYLDLTSYDANKGIRTQMETLDDAGL